MATTKNRGAYPVPPKEVIEQAYAEHKALKPCAERFGVCYETIRKWVKNYGIEINAHGSNPNKRNKTCFRKPKPTTTANWLEKGHYEW